ncbi:MAG: DNA integrity scanning protein DisA nucleotide-binding domain protein, partial [Bacteroidales bacterium]|nr:DNA integrity scanning protein DisA nucleotide-binding domain protein [Bacteroidales bacterium]
RHRSAIGITEQTDAISVIVSEQTGKISVAKQGKVTQGLTLTELQQYLNEEFNEEK